MTVKSLKNFNRGVTDAYGRGKEPDGSFEDSLNLVPTKLGSLETTHGFTKTVSALPTGFIVPTAGVATTFNIVSLPAKPIPFSWETPSAFDGMLYYGLDNQTSPLNHYVLDTWFKGSTTKVSTPNSGFVLLDEYKILTWPDGGAGFTITTAHTFTVASAGAKGLSGTNDYYNGWIINVLGAGNSPSNVVYVTDYGISADLATFTIFEDITSASPNGLDWDHATTGLSYAGNGATLVLQRWFHAVAVPGSAVYIPTFTVASGVGPGKPFCTNSRLRGCGGAYSTETHFPWIAQYINRTFFDGMTAPIEQTYQGTYVDQMEGDDQYSYVTVENPTWATPSGTDYFSAKAYQVGYTIELDGYLETKLKMVEGSAVAAASTETHLIFDASINFSSLNKRATAINIYVKEITDTFYSQAYFLKRVDICTLPATDTWAMTYVSNTGYVKLTGTTSNSLCMTYPDWANHGGTYFDRTGRTEESSTDRNIVSWYDVDIVSGRAFYANVYDPNVAQSLSDEVRFTPIDGNGSSNYDVIPADRLYFSLDVASGDPGSIKRLCGFGSKLYVFKNSQIYSYEIGDTPELWVTNEVSVRDGIYSVESLCKIPELGIVFADADALKLISGGRVLPLSGNIATTYYNFAGKSGILTWYDKIDRSLCFTNGTVANKTFYRGYPDMIYVREDGQTVMPVYPIVVAGALSTFEMDFVYTKRDGTVGFTNNNAFEGVWEWSKTAYLFDDAVIYYYLKTHPIVPDETSLFTLDKIVLTRPAGGATGCGSNNVDALWIDGTAVSSLPAGFSTLTLTHTTVIRKVPVTFTHMGRRFQYRHGNGTAGLNLSTGKLGIDGIDFYLEPVPYANQSR